MQEPNQPDKTLIPGAGCTSAVRHALPGDRAARHFGAAGLEEAGADVATRCAMVVG